MDAPHFRLVVGLGNPGRAYDGTRHNVGFMLLDLLAERDRAPWRRERRWQAEVARSGHVHFCKPLTFMNLSGVAVRSFASFHKIELSQILVVLDDMALPLGKLRLRASGSSGGHHGLRSIIEHFGSEAVARLRLGIGAAGGDAIGHVLGRFALEEREALTQTLDRARSAVDCALSSGLSAAMTAYN